MLYFHPIRNSNSNCLICLNEDSQDEKIGHIHVSSDQEKSEHSYCKGCFQQSAEVSETFRCLVCLKPVALSSVFNLRERFRLCLPTVVDVCGKISVVTTTAVGMLGLLNKAVGNKSIWSLTREQKFELLGLSNTTFALALSGYTISKEISEEPSFNQSKALNKKTVEGGFVILTEALLTTALCGIGGLNAFSLISLGTWFGGAVVAFAAALNGETRVTPKAVGIAGMSLGAAIFFAGISKYINQIKSGF